MLNLIGAVVAFVVIIILIRRRINFGVALLLGSFILGLFSLQEIEVLDIGKAFIQGTIYSFETHQFDFETVELASLMILIYILAKNMQETGAITKLIASLRTIFSKGGILGLIPAVYGLMPVPGGALFSAPLIDKEGKEYHLSKNQKNFLNVWFRHIWFPIYPISSAMILVCSQDFSNINIYLLVLANIPAFVAFVAIGKIYLRLFIKTAPPPKKEKQKEYTGLRYLLPPTIPIVLYALLGVILGFSMIQDYQKSIFIVGVILSIFFLNYLLKLEWKEYLSICKKSLSLKLALAIVGIMIFREMFLTSKANVVIADIMSHYAFPSIIMIILIPLVLGLLTGYNLGAIALSYSLIEPFFATAGITIVGITSLVFMSSLVGYLISPIHLCNVLSSEYLKTDTTRMYAMYVPASFVLLFVQVIFMLVLFST